ncbi:MAG: hypothetical protein M1818_004996 [Claussenomyces sp. TS43310]|nr:MAG: hypothetical protein M1818_004996 [Claussenomyces sp. TS43310]
MPSVGLMNQRYSMVYLSEQDEPQRHSLCLRPDCGCQRSYRSYVVHKDCFDIRANLSPEGATCEEAWEIGTILEPWFPPPVQDTIFKPSKAQLEICLPKLQDSETKKLVQKLVLLPDELFHMIMWEEAGRSALGRISLVSQFNIDLIQRLKRRDLPAELDFASAQLCREDFTFLGIRYQPFKNIYQSTDKSVIRFGVDHLGIRTAEVLDEYPATGRQRRQTCLWYIVEYLSYACTYLKLLQKGPFLRVSSYETERIQMWNVSNPPRRYCSAGRHLTTPRRTRCIDMTALTGLTVFCNTRSIYGIHGHYQDDESAISSYLSLYPSFQHTVMWRYLSLRPGEVITKAWFHEDSGVGNGITLAITTSRGRYSFFGGHIELDSYQILCDKPLEHLLYDDPAPGAAISWFGAVARQSSSGQTSLSDGPKDDGSDPKLHRTYASLEDVIEAEIYRDDYSACTGVLFRYPDNSSELIGQRRVGLSTTTTTRVDSPTKIHIRTFEFRGQDHRDIPYRRQCVDVQFSPGNGNLLFQEWHSQDMIGRVIWLFTVRKDILKLEL